VESAGIAAQDGEPASPLAVEIAAREGIDLEHHQARRVTPELLASSDVVLAMEPRHRDALLALGGDRSRTFVISEWPAPGEPDLEVSDPFGGSSEAYEEAWRRIRRHVARMAPHLIEALRSQSR